jgi:hypothetical protein
MTEGLFTPPYVAGTFDYLPNLTPSEVERFHAMGVPLNALIGPPPLKAGYVVFGQDGFEFEHHSPLGTEGTRAFLFLVTDPWGTALDIVAWCSKTGQLATWLGRAWAIGEDTLYDARLSDHGALPVWRNPLRYLQANREGIVIVRPHAAALYLEDAGPPLAEDALHGLGLEELLTRPRPRILVPAPQEIAA